MCLCNKWNISVHVKPPLGFSHNDLGSEASPLPQGCVCLENLWGARTRRSGRWQVLASLVPMGVLRCSLSTRYLVFSLGFGADRPGPSSQGDYLAWGCGCHSLLTWMWQESLWGGPSAWTIWNIAWELVRGKFSPALLPTSETLIETQQSPYTLRLQSPRLCSESRCYHLSCPWGAQPH